MYYLIVLLTTAVLPILSVVIEHLSRPEVALALLLGKWFTFWGVGVRLLLAGMSQIARPAFTANNILGIDDSRAHVLVSELGYATFAMGLIGALSLVRVNWVAPAAIAGGLFLFCAGVRHALHRGRTRKQSVAMVTDLLVAAAVTSYLWHVNA
jgi:hypothetical protein